MKRRGPVATVPAIALSFACALAAPVARAAGPDGAQTVEQLTDQAYQLQAQGKYAEAIATYLKAYDLSKDALTLLNVATIYDRKLNERELASEYYRRYAMAADAEPDRVKKVTERLTALKAEREDERAKRLAAEQAAARAAAAPPAPVTSPTSATPPPEATSGGTGMRVAGIVVGVLGVAGVGTSFALGSIAKSRNDDANMVCNGAACSAQSGVDAAREAGNYATGATIAFVSGLVLMGGGIALYVAAPKGHSASRATGIFLAPRVDPAGGGFLLHGAF